MAKTNGERHAFQAEVSKLLGLMANSLYRDKEIFLRELISNASDACDKLRYAAITQPDLLGDDAALAVTITPDSRSGVLVVADNGIGMSREELIDNLGTIARSGTDAFVKQMAEAQGSDGEDEQDGQDGLAAGLIGQFGVGFYSCFMVAKRVEVVTRKADEAEGWRWRSDGPDRSRSRRRPTPPAEQGSSFTCARTTTSFWNRSASAPSSRRTPTI